MDGSPKRRQKTKQHHAAKHKYMHVPTLSQEKQACILP